MGRLEFFHEEAGRESIKYTKKLFNMLGWPLCSLSLSVLLQETGLMAPSRELREFQQDTVQQTHRFPHIPHIFMYSFNYWQVPTLLYVAPLLTPSKIEKADLATRLIKTWKNLFQKLRVRK